MEVALTHDTYNNTLFVLINININTTNRRCQRLSLSRVSLSKSKQFKSTQLNSAQIKSNVSLLRRGENRSTRRKISRSRVENQQTQPTYDAESGNRTRATLVEGECSDTAPTLLPKLITEGLGQTEYRKRSSSVSSVLVPGAQICLESHLSQGCPHISGNQSCGTTRKTYSTKG